MAACVVTYSEHGLAAKRSTTFGRCSCGEFEVKGSWAKVSAAGIAHETKAVEICGIEFAKSAVAPGVNCFMFDPTKGI